MRLEYYEDMAMKHLSYSLNPSAKSRIFSREQDGSINCTEFRRSWIWQTMKASNFGTLIESLLELFDEIWCYHFSFFPILQPILENIAQDNFLVQKRESLCALPSQYKSFHQLEHPIFSFVNSKVYDTAFDIFTFPIALSWYMYALARFHFKILPLILTLSPFSSTI